MVPAAASAKPKTIEITGLTYQCVTRNLLEGAYLTPAERLEIAAFSAADGTFTLTGVLAGEDVTPMVLYPDHVPMYSQTFTTKKDIERLYFQTVPV